jgi:type IV pilus assembly protein PilC
MPEQKDKAEKTQTSNTPKANEEMHVRFESEQPGAAEKESVLNKLQDWFKKPPEEAITSFLHQLVMLLEAGVTLLKAISTLASRTSNRALGGVLKDVAERIESGNTLWQSLSHHPKIFDHLFVSIIRAGESSGTLTEIITRLSDYREKKALLRNQVKSALAYPFVVLLASIAVLLLYFIFVVPEFEAMFIKFDIELPAITRFALGFTHVVLGFWWLWLLIIIGIAVAISSFAQTPGGRMLIDRWKLRIPIFGQVVTKKVVADFAHTFATLLAAGSILETLDLTKEAVGNAAFAQDLQQVRESIERGEGLEKPLRRSTVVPPIVTDMLATGEESGSLDRISLQMAEIYEREVENAVNSLKSLIEPVMILGLGLVVLFLTLSFFWPYISMIGQMTGIE